MFAKMKSFCFGEMKGFCISFLLAFCASFLLVVSINFYIASLATAKDDNVWHVAKATGDIWVTTSGISQVSLTDESILKPGDNIRTGRTGRALLVHGREAILISPNTVIGIPSEKKDGVSTRIIQQAGSILLEVEKRNVKHFEVETPFLAALVKGTQFRVTVNDTDASVDVLRGQVEVSDFKSGQYALVQKGQAAKVLSRGSGGLLLSGSGTLKPIQQGAPRKSSVTPILVPKEGLSAPLNGKQVRLVLPLEEFDSILASSGGKVSENDARTASRVTPQASNGGGSNDVRPALPLGQFESVFASSGGKVAENDERNSTRVTPQASDDNGSSDGVLSLMLPFAAGIAAATASTAVRRRKQKAD